MTRSTGYISRRVDLTGQTRLIRFKVKVLGRPDLILYSTPLNKSFHIGYSGSIGFLEYAVLRLLTLAYAIRKIINRKAPLCTHHSTFFFKFLITYLILGLNYFHFLSYTRMDKILVQLIDKSTSQSWKWDTVINRVCFNWGINPSVICYMSC